MKFLKFSKYFAGFLAATLTFTSAMSAVDVISGNIAVAYADELDEGSETPSEEPATEISEPASESSGNEGGSSDNGGNGEEGNTEYSDPVSEPAPTEDNEENTGSEETPAETPETPEETSETPTGTPEETPTDVTDETEGTNPEASEKTGEGVGTDETIDEPAGTEENPITDEEETPVEPTEKEPIVVNSLEDIPLEDIILGENGEAMVIRDEDGNPLTYNIVDPATGEIIQGDAPYTYGHFNDVVKEVKDSIEALTNCINEFKAQGGNMEDPYVKFIVGQKQAEIDAKIAELEETAELLKKQLEEEKAKKEKAEKIKKEIEEHRTENRGAYAASAEEIRLLAALIWCEAGNQSYEGMVAVGAVVMNRVKSPAYPNTIYSVIYASGQFTPAMSGKVARIYESGPKDICYQAAAAALNGETTVGGATHFRRNNGRPGYVLGDHVFW